MRFRPHLARWLSSTLFIALLAGCSSPPPSKKTSAPAPRLHLESGLTDRERETFYHEPEGSEFIPLAVLRALRGSTGQPLIDSFELYGLLKDPQNPDGLPVGMAKHRPPGVFFDVVGFNCAACHVNELTYKGTTVRVDGAPALFSLNAFYIELFQSLDKTLHHPTELAGFLIRLAEHTARRKQNESDASLLRRVYDDENWPTQDEDVHAHLKAQAEHHAQTAGSSEAQFHPPSLNIRNSDDVDSLTETVTFLKQHIAYLKTTKNLDPIVDAGPGRLDAFDGARALMFGATNSLNLPSPVSYPFLWGFSDQKWLHYDANTNSLMQRNMGQAIGLGATYKEDYSSTLLPQSIGVLNKISGKIKAPRWPKEVFGPIDLERSKAGQQVFNVHCAGCHGPGADKDKLYAPGYIGTDSRRAETFNTPINGKPFSDAIRERLTVLENKAYADAHLTPKEIEAIRGKPPEWQSTGMYSVRPLNGIWATAPYLHNGSVPTLWALLQPADKRPTCFQVGQREYDPVNLGYAAAIADNPDKCTTGPNLNCPSTEKGFSDTWLNATCPGNRNTGHEYGTGLSDESKRQLLEYLKTL
jgi:cytochrome c553